MRPRFAIALALALLAAVPYKAGAAELPAGGESFQLPPPCYAAATRDCDSATRTIRPHPAARPR